MRRISLYLLFFCISFVDEQTLFAQAKTQDSLFAIAFKKNPDSNAVNALQAIQRNFFNSGLYDSAFKYAQELIALTTKLDDKKNLSEAWYKMGAVCTNLTLYDSAGHYTSLAEQAALEQKDSFLLVNCYIVFAIQYRYQSDYSTSLSYAIKGATIAEHSRDSSIIKLIPKLYASIGNNLIEENQLTKAIEYEKKALRYTNYVDEQRYRIILLLDIAYAYTKLKQFESAKEYVSMAVTENDLFNNIILDILTFDTQGYYYDQIKDYPAALSAYRKSYHYSDSAGNEYLKAEAAVNLAALLVKQKKYKNALVFAKEGNDISIRLKHFKVAARTFQTMKDIAVAEGNYQLGLKYAEQNKRYADSATNQETQKLTVSLERKYQTEKKEKEIADLTIANTAKELEVVKRNRLLLGGGITALSLLVILTLLYRNTKQKQLLVAKENSLHQEQIKFLKRQQQVLSLQSMVNGQENERSRIAKDLHDGLGGLFSTIKMYFSTLKHEQPFLKKDILFEKSFELIDAASEEVRRIAHNMMPEGLMKLGLMFALQDMFSNINTGKLIQVKFQSYGMEKRMSASIEIILYRILQELLNNIIKHAQATMVIVQFNREDDRLTVTVEDNGRGFNLQETDEKKHTGLESIRSRVNYLNGNISIDSERGVGTTILMEFLINSDQEIS